MTDPIYPDARTGSSGKQITGTPGHVLAIAPSGIGIQPVPPGGGGSVAPTPPVAWVWSASPLTPTPDGSLGAPFRDLQDALAAGFTSLLVLPGTYSGITLTDPAFANLDISVKGYGPVGRGAVGMGLVTTKNQASITLENVTAGGIDDSNSTQVVVVQVIDFVSSADFVGSGSTVFRSGTTLQNVLPGFEPNAFQNFLNQWGAISLAWARLAGDITGCTTLDAIYSRGIGASAHLVRLTNCTFTGDVLTTANGLSVVRSCTMNVGSFDQIDAHDSTFTSEVGVGVDPTKNVFRNCTLLSGASSTITADSATERASYRAGGDVVPDGAQVFSLDDAAGDQTQFNTTTTLTPGALGPTRAVAGINTVAGQKLTVGPTGSADKQSYFVDTWSVEAVDIDSGAGVIATMPAQAAGQGMRFRLTFNGGTGRYTFTDFRRLA